MIAAERSREVPEARKEAKKGLSMVIPLIVMDWGFVPEIVVAGVSVLLAQESSHAPEAETCSTGVVAQLELASHDVVSSQGVVASVSKRVVLEHAVIFDLPLTAALWGAVIFLYMAMRFLTACLVALVVAEWKREFVEREAIVEEVNLEQSRAGKPLFELCDMVAIGRNGVYGRGRATGVDSKYS